jgi:hypothetical protein
MSYNRIKPFRINAMKFTILFAFILSTSVLSACAAKPDQVANTKTSTTVMSESAPAENSENKISTTGTVRFQEMEGGFWGIIGDDGNKYDPMGLSPEFQKDGLRVRFEATPETDMMSTHMWGTMINLSHIEVMK